MKKAKGYTGHKKIFGTYHKIINQIPACKQYVELFAGSASIASLMSVLPEDIILNDLDRSVTENLRCTFPKAKVTNHDYSYVLHLLKGTDKKIFIFIDPPYLHSTRPNSTKLYKHEMSDDDHIRLLSSVLQLKCNIMIIHPKCELYDKKLKNWRKVEIKIRYNNKTSIECLYMNYEVPSTLQNDSYLGKDCWDRQRIKRKANSLVNKLLNLPELERNYIINRVQEKFKAA